MLQTLLYYTTDLWYETETENLPAVLVSREKHGRSVGSLTFELLESGVKSLCV